MLQINPNLSGYRLIETLIGRFGLEQCAAVSSFGADSAVLLHLIAQVDVSIPVVFIDTGMHFAQTLQYRDQLVNHLGLANVKSITPGVQPLLQTDPDSTLHLRDPDACCTLRKVQPLSAALEPFACWFNGRKQFQAGSRGGLGNIEIEPSGRLRANPLYNWTETSLKAYRTVNKLPRHPLEIHGYQSIGCRTCTVPGCNSNRSGRWAGTQKTECGIFFDASGKAVRATQPVAPE